jgi:hypothetical protein
MNLLEFMKSAVPFFSNNGSLGMVAEELMT